MAITIIVAIVAVAVALLIAVPITCKVAVNNKVQKDAEVVGTAEDRARSIIDEALKTMIARSCNPLFFSSLIFKKS